MQVEMVPLTAELTAAAGIKPMATLYHWDLPTALYEKGSWKNPDSPKWFEEYVEVVSKALRDYDQHLVGRPHLPGPLSRRG